MGFSRQEYWSGLPFSSPADLPNPGIEPRSPALQTDALPSEPLGKLVMALNEIKTNIQKQETKDEPQTKGSYKIRQIIIKIMEYTHIHIHP